MLNNSVSAVHEGGAELSLNVRHRPATTSDTQHTLEFVDTMWANEEIDRLYRDRDKMTDYIGTERLNGLVTMGQMV